MEIIECPRDAVQGIKTFIPTKLKIKYLRNLLEVGFSTIDIGSFVSPKAIPQMRDTSDVLEVLSKDKGDNLFLVIVANLIGVQNAVKHSCVDYIGYPFSISENFQMRNTHKTIHQSVEELKNIISIAQKNHKEIVVYLSMGFGNPYGDPWGIDIVEMWVYKLQLMGIRIISLSDTVGTSIAKDINSIFKSLIPKYPHIEFGAHLHTTPTSWHEKLDSAYKAGCRRFDGALMGYGGCPMAKDVLTGNMPTEKIVSYMKSQNLKIPLNINAFEDAYHKAQKFFSEL